MGEIFGFAIVFLIIVVALVAAMSWARGSATQRKQLLNTPAVLLPDGEPPDMLLANAQRMHALAQDAVRVLDRIANNPEYVPTDWDRKEARRIVGVFYDHR